VHRTPRRAETLMVLIALMGGVNAARMAAADTAAPAVPPAFAAADSAPAAATAPIPFDPAFAAVDSMRAHLGRLERTAGHAQLGNAVTDWEAYFKGSALRYARETIQSEDFGKRENEYLYEGARLRVFRSRGARSLTDPKDPRAGPFDLRIAWDAAGKVKTAFKNVGGRPANVEDSEPSGALGRAEWLRQLAQNARGAVKK
jgi:hypothetical protein